MQNIAFSYGRKLLPLLLLLIICFQVRGEITLPALISTNMVLQHNSTVKVWGWAEAGEKVTIKASWLTEASEVITNSEGKWQSSINLSSVLFRVQNTCKQ